MKYWTFAEYKQNRIDAAESRNNTNTWTKTHQIKPQYSVWGWIKAVCRFYFTKASKETILNPDSLDFSDM